MGSLQCIDGIFSDLSFYTPKRLLCKKAYLHVHEVSIIILNNVMSLRMVVHVPMCVCVCVCVCVR